MRRLLFLALAAAVLHTAFGIAGARLAFSAGTGLWAQLAAEHAVLARTGDLATPSGDENPAALIAAARRQHAQVRQAVEGLASHGAGEIVRAGNDYLAEYRAQASRPCAWAACTAASPRMLDPREGEIARRRIAMALQRHFAEWQGKLDAFESALAGGDANRRQATQAALIAWSVGAERGTPRAVLKSLARRAHDPYATARHFGQAADVLGAAMSIGFLVVALLGTPAWPAMLFAACVHVAAFAHVSLGLEAPLLHLLVQRHLEGLWYAFAALAAGVLAGAAVCRIGGIGEGWIGFSTNVQALWRGCAIAAAAGVVLLLPISGAARAELFIALGSFALAVFATRNLAWYDAAGTATALGWPVVAGGFAGCAAIAVAAGDLGAAVLACGLCGAWLLLCGSARTAAVGCTFALAACIVWLALLPPLQADPVPPMPAPLRSAIGLLPLHAQVRFEVAWAPFQAGPSDVARAIWMSTSAGADGWWPQTFPAEGFAVTRAADRTIVQLSEDYFAALLQATFGAAAPVLIALHMLVFAWAGTTAIAAAGTRTMSTAGRLAAFWAAFGCIGVSLRTIVSSAGSLGTLPLTGVPIPALSHGHAAGVAAGLYLGIALAAAHAGRREC